LPPRRAGAGHRLTIHPGANPVSARAGETLLEAGLRAGLALPYDCRAGGCGVCMCTVLAGKVDHGDFQPAALTAAMRARGQTLMCCAKALEDVEFEVDVPSLGAVAAGGPVRYRATVGPMERLAPDVMRLRLALPEGQRIDFAAGQYINIVLDDGTKRAFSFASAPGAGDDIELHVRLVPGGRFTTQVFERMRQGDVIEFEGPVGRFTLHEGDRPILFLAGATGFAPIKSIVEDAMARGIQRPMWLYWGVRERKDLYMAELAEHWANEHANFHFVPVLSDAPEGRCLERPPRPGASQPAAGSPRPDRVRGLRLRLDTHGRVRGARLHGPRPARAVLLLGRVPALGADACCTSASARTTLRVSAALPPRAA
jgi:CDP-4-dehydro-6-deoxyglucose reductase